VSSEHNDFIDKYGSYALIAGGSDGLGFAFAEAIARRGLNLILIARGAERLQAAAERLKAAYPIDVVTIAADMADIADVEARIDALPEVNGQSISQSIGLLVYNAAFAPIGRFEALTEEQLATAAAVNVRGPLLLAKWLSEQMIRRNRGGIVLMSSLVGTTGSPDLTTYAATKSFNTTLAEGLWKGLKPLGVDVLACCAGAILTPGYQQAMGEGDASGKPAPGTLPAKTVAECAITALAKGKGPVIVPGVVNKLGRFALGRILSTRAAIALMSKFTGDLK
jgi:short-subunit dehydrogenase